MGAGNANIDHLLRLRAPLSGPSPASGPALTILFADAVTATGERPPSAETLKQLAEFTANTIREFGGRIARAIEGAVMAEFPAPAPAVHAGIELHRRLPICYSRLPSEARLPVRVGIHAGPGYRAGDDLHGEAVDIAAAVTRRAAVGQVLISRAVRSAVLMEPDVSCRWLGKTTAEGRAESLDLYEVLWQEGASEEVQPAVASPPPAELPRSGGSGPAPPASSPPPGPASEETLDVVLPRPPIAGAPVTTRYEILGKAGSGGMGTVYKARDRETGEVVAIKVLRAEIAADQAAMERFKNELRLARKITHKNVCRIHEFHRTDDSAYISMEFVDGESLRHVLNRFGNLSVRKGLQIAAQICAGLREAHSQGVVHRDLKPENIMLDRAGQVKVMDFGIARSVHGAATLTGALIGTPAYMAPEQAEGKVVDHRADIYALGLILYEVFAGEAAFRADTPASLLLKQIRDVPAPPSEIEPTVPAHIEKAILRCLEKDPARRFASVDELEAALVRKSEPPRVAPPEGADVPLPVHMVRWQRADWLLLATAWVAMAVFLALFDRVLPFAAVQPAINRSEAIAAARRWVEKYAPETKGDKYSAWLMSQFAISRFPDDVLYFGREKALEHLADGPSWWVSGTGDERAPARSRASFGRDGKLGTLRLPEDPAGSGKQPQTLEEALPEAVRHAEELFGLRLAGRPPRRYVVDPKRSAWIYTEESPRKRQLIVPLSTGRSPLAPVEWDLEGPSPEKTPVLRIHLTTGRLKFAFLEKTGWWDRPPGYRDAERSRMRWWRRVLTASMFVFSAVCLLCLVLFVTRRLYLQNFRLVWAGSLLTTTAAAAILWAFGGERQASRVSQSFFEEYAWIYIPLALVVTLLLAYGVLSVPHHYLMRSLPRHLKNLSDLLRKPFAARPAGLAMLRGAMFGAGYLGFHAVVLFILGALGWAAPGLAVFDAVRAEAGTDVLGMLCMILGVTLLSASLYIALPMALLQRANFRARALLTGTAMVWMLAPTWLAGPALYPALPFYLAAAVQGLFLGWVFWRYDLLTCMSCIFTLQTWIVGYPLFRMFMKAEPGPYSLVLLPWCAGMLLGLAIWFRPQLGAGWRRLAAVFE